MMYVANMSLIRGRGHTTELYFSPVILNVFVIGPYVPNSYFKNISDKSDRHFSVKNACQSNDIIFTTKSRFWNPTQMKLS